VYNQAPKVAEREPLEKLVPTDSNIFFLDYSHLRLSPVWYADAEGAFVPEESGMYDFGVCVQGIARLYIDGELVVSNVENQRSGPSFLGSGTLEGVGEKELVARRPYQILVQWGCAKTSQSKVPGVVDFGHGGSLGLAVARD